MDPRAVAKDGTTYFGYCSGDDGNACVRSITGGVVSAETVLASALDTPADDHAAPSLLIRPDGRIVAFYTPGDGPTLACRISTSPGDISAFGSPITINTASAGGINTYSQPILIDGTIHLFFRNTTPAPEFDWSVVSSTDGGATWSSKTTIMRQGLGRRSYWKIAQDGDRIHFAVANGHPMHDTDTSIFHFYWDGTYRLSDGTPMGSPPFDSSDMTPVYDGTTTRAWVWDIAIDDGDPRIVFATFPSTADIRYQYATWDGAAWSVDEIAAAGGHISNGAEPYYAGGVVIDRLDPRVVYASRQVSGQWEMFRYATPDDGATWSPLALTSASSDKNIRPVPVAGSDGLRVVWMVGTYAVYTDYSVGTNGRG